ncbi:hypothetical protein [Teredinibacter sp. KSP-S5-2]|uniref:hypothetical protein n=1 Tax=Teredinibacter sp. KSP-S5-2 TaxID=3034506 RepID=UPI002934901B|nr:hypothetical protein [Teredinibacter sp. KSP-S5-2]WNO10893.1 hypothetical protein P5V12_06855 [Teredinibacter sp. KSP-S5-2]
MKEERTRYSIWMQLRILSFLISKTRFSALVILLFILSYTAGDQTLDIFIGLNLWHIHGLFFVLGIIWWATQSWGWARFILNDLIDRAKAGDLYLEDIKIDLSSPYIDHLPRMYALIAYLVASYVAFNAEQDVLGWFLLPLGIVFYVFAHFRTRIKALGFCVLSEKGGLKLRLMIWTILLVLLLYSIVSPVHMGWLLGPGGTIFFGLGAIVPIGSHIVYHSDRLGVPAVTLIFLWIFVVGTVFFEHNVRILPGEPDQRRPLHEYWDQWLDFYEAQHPVVEGESRPPLVLVATAGGGSRSAYWTALLLGALEENVKAFHEHVFAISGVSGGAVGGMFYVSALGAEHAITAEEIGVFEDKLKYAVGTDFLSPLMAAWLYADLAHSFFPFIGLPDRSRALEESWALALKDHFGQDCLNQPYLKLYDGKPETYCSAQPAWLPIMISNSTHEESGKRIIAAPFTLESHVFKNAIDFYHAAPGYQYRASTIAHNAARFPYVSPAGGFGSPLRGHVLDGGYFENYGAETLKQLLGVIRKKAAEKEIPIAVVMISNDVTLTREDYQANSVFQNFNPAKIANQVLAPVLGLANARESRGILAFKELSTNICEDIDKGCLNSFYHFHLNALPEEAGVAPIGWVLSDLAKENIAKQVCKSDNYQEFTRLVNVFGQTPMSKQVCERRFD